MKIYFLEPIGVSIEQSRVTLSKHEIIELDTRGWSDEQLIQATHDADILVLTNRQISAIVIKSLTKLKMIAVAFAGIDHIDQNAAQLQNILINNAAGYANTAVAELTLGFMIALARNIPQNSNSILNGAKTNTGSELKGKNIGIVGYGAIGKEVERLARAFGMNPIIFSRSYKNTLDDIFRQSDFVTLHIPLTKDTKGLIGNDLLSIMKPSAFLINCARGPIINTNDLIQCLDNGSIAGAALDVFDMEPPLPNEYPLLKYSNVIATPHIGFNTNEALQTKGKITLNNILAFISSFKN
jgi:D-3-phosphoglycerate dehydrogenase